MYRQKCINHRVLDPRRNFRRSDSGESEEDDLDLYGTILKSPTHSFACLARLKAKPSVSGAAVVIGITPRQVLFVIVTASRSTAKKAN